jgi:carbonic anhydrase
MDKLIEGYRAFRQTYFTTHRAMFDQLAQGQAPKAMVISCCDSRVDPNLIFNAGPGEIFVLRNVANLVPPYSPDDSYHGTSSAIEFAVRGLNVGHLVVMGHSRCGGVRALLGAHEGEFIGPWMRIAEDALKRTVAAYGDAGPEVLQRVCEREVLKTSLRNLRGFPWIRERLKDGRLVLHGWYFDIERGELLCLDEQTGNFTAL